MMPRKRLEITHEFPYYIVARSNNKEWFQRSANRIINDRAGRINHLFGGPYKGSLITTERYYYHVVKYLYRNPVEAKVVDRVENYRYSSLELCALPLVTPITGIGLLIPKERQELLSYLNEGYSREAYEAVKCGVSKTEFKVSNRICKSVRRELSCRGKSQ